MSDLPTWDEAIEEICAVGERFEMEDIEVYGRKVKAFKNVPDSLRAIYDNAMTRADQTYLVYGEETWTFGEVVGRAGEVAAALTQDYGVEPGDRVAIAMRNYPEWIVSFAAITSIGGIAVCLNAWWTSEEMAYGLEDCRAKVLICDSERLERGTATLKKLGTRSIVARAEGGLPTGVVAFADVGVPGTAMPDVDIDPDWDAMILYTSGTTGVPRGAVSSHRAIMNAIMANRCGNTVSSMLFPPKEEHPYPVSFILCVPLFHVTGLIPVMLSTFSDGYKLAIMYKWDPEAALTLIEREQITHFVGVPTMSFDLLESPDFANRDTSSLLFVGGGGAPAPPELVHRIDKSFARGRPGLGFGMTETCSYGPRIVGDDLIRKPRSIGRTVPVMQMKIGDADGNELARGEIGEFFVAGPTLIRGYWNKPEATAEAIVEGWLRTGDIGRMDEEGFVYIEDRAKDMVIRAGENIYSVEVESVIYEHPAVHEAAVFGVPHQRLGEEVAVAIYPRQGKKLAADDIVRHASGRLASFKIPTIIEIVTEKLPRNAAGKILKRDLRDRIVQSRETNEKAGE